MFTVLCKWDNIRHSFLFGMAVIFASVAFGVLIPNNLIFAVLGIGIVLYFFLFFFLSYYPWLSLLIIAFTSQFNVLQRVPGLPFFSVSRVIGLILVMLIINKYLRKKYSISVPYFGFLYLLMLISFLIAGLNGLFLEGFSERINPLLSLGSYFIIFVSVMEFVNSDRQIKWIIKASVLAAVLISLISVFQFISGSPVFGDLLGLEYLGRKGALTVRAVGAADNPNIGALIPAIALPVLYSLWQLTDKTFQKGLIGLSFILVSSHLLLALSRSAWIGAIVGLVVIGIFDRSLNIIQIVAVIAIAISLISFFAPVEVFQARFNSILTLEEALSSGRIHVFRSLPTIFSHWGFLSILGMGIGNSPDVIGLATGFRIAPHNTLIAILIEGGVAGLIIYVLLFIRIFRLTIKAVGEAERAELLMQAGLLGGIIAWQIHGLFHNYLLWIGGWLMVALLMKYNLLIMGASYQQYFSKSSHADNKRVN